VLRQNTTRKILNEDTGVIESSTRETSTVVDETLGKFYHAKLTMRIAAGKCLDVPTWPVFEHFGAMSHFGSIILGPSGGLLVGPCLKMNPL